MDTEDQIPPPPPFTRITPLSQRGARGDFAEHMFLYYGLLRNKR